MQGILYDDSSVYIFILVTLILGGAAAYSTGRAIAITWRPDWHLIASALVLGVAVRFIHHALFGADFLGSLAGLQFYCIDTVLLLIAAFVGFRLTRVRQMTTRYRWLYEAAGPFSWRPATQPRGGS